MGHFVRQIVGASAVAVGLACGASASEAGVYYPKTYQEWLLIGQSGNNAALYNQPCSVSDGERITIIACPIAAAAFYAYTVPPGYYGGDVVAPYYRHRHAYAHGGPILTEKY
jgi:hypothetical protein